MKKWLPLICIIVTALNSKTFAKEGCAMNYASCQSEDNCPYMDNRGDPACNLTCEIFLCDYAMFCRNCEDPGCCFQCTPNSPATPWTGAVTPYFGTCDTSCTCVDQVPGQAKILRDTNYNITIDCACFADNYVKVSSNKKAL